MCNVTTSSESQKSQAIRAALCVGEDAFDRLGQVLRHLAVGLVDQGVGLRLVSCDARMEAHALGPIQSLIHPRISWPGASRKLDNLLDRLSPAPPVLVHAIGAKSYGVAVAIAEAFDADLALQVTSAAECDDVADFNMSRVGALLCVSQPLATALEAQLTASPKLIRVIPPGVFASQKIACFSHAGATPTLLCTSPFERASGIEEIIEAVDLLGQRGHTMMVFLLGAGPREGALRRLVRERGLSASVTFANPTGDLKDAMRSTDIFIRPSGDSAFHVHPLQAMGVGTVVITYPSPICDYYRNQETAVICPQPTGSSLADTIEPLLTDRARARRIATSALEYVRAHHSMSGMAERTATVYRELAFARATFSIGE